MTTASERVETPHGDPIEAPGDPILPRRASGVGITRQLLGLLGRPTITDRASWLLPVTAMAVASTLSLSVAGGVHFFFGTTGELAGMYRFLSAVALVLLLIPLMTLAGAAARLSARRRDTRLSSLRLLGATSSVLRLLTLAETGAMALAGALAGVIGYLALMPVFGLLHFNGAAIGAGRMWLGLLPVVGAVLGIVALALVSSVIGLRKVEISPLGVRTRQQAPLTSRWRAVLAVAGILLASVLGKLLGAAADELAMGVMMVVMFALPMLAVNLAGPWVVSLVARVDLRRARTAPQLLAARSVLEDPKQVWRQIGAVGLTTFVAVFLGVGLAMTNIPPDNPTERLMMDDIRTGVLLTLAITFVTVACSVGINQTAAVLDRRQLYVGLDMLGMPDSMIDRARRRAVLRPILAVVLLSGAAALALVLPLGVANSLTDPTAALTVGAVLLAGIGLVWASLAATRLTLRQVLAAGLVRAE
ncbi:MULTISPECIES: ABC transporter permease [unclassified Luteococcus]|uniref:ABC transporter permease n=1 Tax=unclassified Luteococcus TaxID=2639923 RepID=UPI00313E8035